MTESRDLIVIENSILANQMWFCFN